MKSAKLKKEKRQPEEEMKKKALVKKTKATQTIKSKPEQKLRVLILEDNPADAELMARQLKKSGFVFVSQRVENKGEFLKALKAFKPDLILADYSLPKFNALQALELRKINAPLIPFIIITGSVSEEVAVECMKQGADDYLLKDRLARLGEALRHAVTGRRLQAEKAAAEETLQKSEENFVDIFQTVREGIAYTTLSGKVISINSALEQILDMPREDIVGKNILALAKGLLAQENAKKVIPMLKKLVQGKRIDGFQIKYKEKVLEISSDINRKTKRLTGVIRDITERNHYEEALLAAAQRWRTTFDSMNDAVCLLDENGAILQCNRAMNRLLGLSYKTIIGKDCLSLVCGPRRKSVCGFRLLMKDGKRHEEEISWRQRWFQVTVDPILGDDGRVLGAVHIMADITDAKKAKEALRESEERFRGLYENANIGMYRTTPDGRILMANPALIRMLGYGSFAELAKRNLQKEGFQPDYPRRDFRREVEHVGSVTGLEAIWNKKDGTSIFVRESARGVKDAEGTIVFYDGTVEDISDRKRAENILHEMNEIFRLFLKHNPIYVFIKDENIRPVYLSENYEKLLGRPIKEILGKSMDELFPSELSRTMVEDDKRILREGRACEFIEELEGRIYSTLKFPIFIEGKPKYLAGYTTDITEHRQSQELLQATSRRLELALESAKAGTWDWDVAAGHIEWSPSMFDLFGLNPQTESASFASWRKALHPEDRELAEQRIELALKKNETLNSDYRVVWPDGQIRWINATGIGVNDDQGRPRQMIGICVDITERKRTEEQICASLLEKEVLLKEIHHRVKNNLQVISGLLTLQSAQINDERFQQMIKESQGRIWTMALIHQTLYQSGNLADIDMADYIRSLSGNLLSSQARIAMPPTVIFDLLPLRLTIDKAIPLALIINELLTNAFKHAFPDGRPGEVRISLQESRGVKFYAPTDNKDAAQPVPEPGHATYELTIADNGVGLPEGFDPKKQKSLGLQLVDMLVKQLEGSLAIESSDGTSVHISFETNEKSKKQA